MKWAFVPTRKGIALSGMMAIGVAVGMAMAHNRLMKAGVVGAKEGAQVLALPAFAFFFSGVIVILAAVLHAQVIEQ